jgi:membrane-associated phospholipid phosphatase
MRTAIFILILADFTGSFAQDSISHIEVPVTSEKPQFFNRVWGPASLGLISGLTMIDDSKYGLQELVRRPLNDSFHTNIDDYIHYTSVAMMYGADLLGVKARNNAWNQTKYLFFSEVITLGIVTGLKYALRIERPDGSTLNSYPSGHTSQAFVQAQVLFNEFRDTHPVFASSGYIFAVSTGALRVMNNRHWVPDVLMGAGIGMLVANIVYHIEPLKNWNPFKRDKDKKSEMMLTPVLGGQYFGCRMGIAF